MQSQIGKILNSSKIFIDGVIFQIQKGRPAGISRVWMALLEKLAKTSLAKDIILLDRANTLPEIKGFEKITISEYKQSSFESDSLYLEYIIEQQGGGVFISTYYTYAENSPCIIILHDMTPETFCLNWDQPEWRAKQKAISKSSAYFSVSESTKKDFYKYYPQEAGKPVTVICNAVSEKFSSPTDAERRLFKRTFSIRKPYFIYCGHRLGYKNAISFIKAFNMLPEKENYEIFFTGGDAEFEKTFRDQLKGIKYQLQFLTDKELAIAYSGALALVYPSLYEGFGLPILEAMRAGCPVIAGNNSSIPEVAGDSALLVDTSQASKIREALIKVQDPLFRKELILKGFENVKRFSWEETGKIFSSTLDSLRKSELGFNETEKIDSWERYIRSFYWKPELSELLKAFSDSIRRFDSQGSSFDFRELMHAEKRIAENITDDEFANMLSAFQLSDKDIMLAYWCGIVYESRQNYADAFKAYEIALTLTLPNVRITYLAANAAYRLNKKLTAVKLYRLLLSVNRNFYEGITRLNELESYTSKIKEEMHLEQIDLSLFDINGQNIIYKESQSPFISVIIPTRDRNEGLEEVLASLPGAMNSLTYEVIIYTSKKSYTELNPLLKQFNISKIFFDEDLFGKQKFNWSKLMNDAFSKAQGEWIVYASDDIEFLPNSFHNAFTSTAADDKTGGITFLHKNTIETYGEVFNNYGYDLVNEFVYINFGVIRKNVFEKIKGFDEHFSFYWADADLCLRIWEAGFKIIPSPYSLVNHNNINDRLKQENSGDKYFLDTYYFYNKWQNRKLIPEAKILSKRRKYLSEENELKVLSIITDRQNCPGEQYEDINKIVTGTDKPSKEITVSAIVSTYNSEKYLRGCLDDLLNQTLYKKGELEIIVINSGSEQNEEQIVKEYQAKCANIKYLKTERETIYNAWNRGIKLAGGKYITNANTDDRHRTDALEMLAAELEKDIKTGLVYADQFVTYKNNETFEKFTAAGKFEWPEFDRIQLLHCAICGPQPMWRKDLHQTFGYFNDKLVVAGDYEWWLRISESVKIVHITETLGLYLLSDESIEHKFTNEMLNETGRVRAFYAEKMNISQLNYEIYKSTFLKLFPVNKLFSVIISTYNRSSELKSAVQSVLDQTYQHFEIIVVNDGGCDSKEILNDFKDNRILYFSHSENKGLAAARNTGLLNSKGDYIAFLDDDDKFKVDHLETALKYLRQGNRVVYTDAVRNTFIKVKNEYLLIKKSVPYSIDYDRNKLLLANISPVNCFVFERDLLKESGLLNERYRVLEDWEFWLRLSKYSEFYHINKVTVEVNWKDDGSTITSSQQKEFQSFRDDIYKTYSEEIDKISNKEQLLAEFHRIWIADSQISPLVSVIVPTYNQIEYTKEFVESLYKSTQIPFELIVIINNKDDGTKEYLKDLSEKKNNIFPIINEQNQGFPKSINQGLKAAKGEYLLVINNDVVMTEFCIEKLLDALNRNVSAGLAGPISNIVSGFQRDNNAHYKSIAEMHKYAKTISLKNKNLHVQFPRIAFLCTLIKSEVIKKIGGLDERFSPGNFEDDDFCLRAQLAGYKTIIAKDVFIHHYGSKSFKAEGNRQYEELIEKNRSKFIDKWGADPDDIWIKGKTIKKRNINFPINRDSFIESFERALIHIEDDEIFIAEKELSRAMQTYHSSDKKNFNIEYSEVSDLAEKIKSAGNTKISEMLTLVGEYINSGELEKAKTLIKAVLERDNSNLYALNNLALINILKNDLISANDLLKEILNIDPNNEIALNNLQYLNENR